MKNYFVILIFLINLRCYSQTAMFSTTAQGEAIGNTTATTSYYGSVFNNIAGIAALDDITVSVSFKVVPDALWQNILSASTALPSKYGTVGFGFIRYGDKLFNQQLIAVGFANNFGIASLGIRASYLQYTIEGSGSRAIPFFDFGGIAKLSPQLFVGAYIININQAKIADFNNERFPTIITAGLSYRPTEKLMVNIEIEQDIDFDASFKTGLSYKIISNLTVRTGINTNPNRQYFGVGFEPDNILMKLDYALANTKYIGLSHQISLSYCINRLPK